MAASAMPNESSSRSLYPESKVAAPFQSGSRSFPALELAEETRRARVATLCCVYAVAFAPSRDDWHRDAESFARRVDVGNDRLSSSSRMSMARYRVVSHILQCSVRWHAVRSARSIDRGHAMARAPTPGARYVARLSPISIIASPVPPAARFGARASACGSA